MPKAGVWAVRAGAPLAENLARAATDRRCGHGSRNMRRWLILGLGGGRAVAWRNGAALWGGLVWRWKDWIDRRWMRRYRPADGADPAAPMRCGGCGAKVGAEVLSSVLSGLSGTSADGFVLGLDAADDAAVPMPPPGMAVVQSVDHFRAFIDDPFVFGEIAAAHALSDLHAMGARPWTALAVAAVPYLGGAKMRDDLAAMMQGATRVLGADGCALVGGHSSEGRRRRWGSPSWGWRTHGGSGARAGCRPGDALVLTKPLGTGIMLAGHMRGLAKARWLVAALESMRRTNGAAARVLGQFGVTACTDVTGFGLAGHLGEMLQASSVGATVWAERMPVLAGASGARGTGGGEHAGRGEPACTARRGSRRDCGADGRSPDLGRPARGGPGGTRGGVPGGAAGGGS